MDVMWLDNNPVLQIVDSETEFKNSLYIKDESATKLWNDLINLWFSASSGFPETIQLCRETCFTSPDFKAKR